MSKAKIYIKENYLPIIMFIVLSVIETAVIFPIMYGNCLGYDSSYQYGLTRHTIPEIWRLLPADYSPPFYAIALKLYCMVFGHTLVVMRTFSIFAVVGMLFVAAFPVNTLFNKKTAVYCLIITFCSTTMLNLMHEIRPTIFAMFFYMAVTVYAGIAYSTGKRYSYICLVVFSLLSMYTHNVAMVGTFCIYVALLLFSAVKKDWKKLRNFFICGGICGILYLPWLKIIFFQLSKVRNHFWVSPYFFNDSLEWIFNDFQNSNTSYLCEFVIHLAFSISLFLALLSHINLKKLKGAQKFRDIVKAPQEKTVYERILLIFTVIIFSILMMEIVSLVVSNMRAQRYYYILGTAFIVVLSAVLSNFGNKICCLIYLCSLLVNQMLNTVYIKSEIDNSTMDTIVSVIEERCPDKEISFLHTHEYSLGIMSYYFPDAKHYVYDETNTVLGDYSVFGTEVIEIGGIENIWNYTDQFYTFSNHYLNFQPTNYILDELEEIGNCDIIAVGEFKMAYDYFVRENEVVEVVLTNGESNNDMEAEQ